MRRGGKRVAAPRAPSPADPVPGEPAVSVTEVCTFLARVTPRDGSASSGFPLWAALEVV